ncbi:capsular biosynthesis protein [Salipaludibacillus neizhouensis]|uniref:non-specific protein-tyrosine kinase n=1 Tax=Salipaludibacillus neizhouensis TaxID=885475 RepID=A0A3A9K645_9BACI|nr:CpsD/CapB family tyrosine-protein kinase [Salipaludibacillus neizhouensis]RKL68047.1 capsular biosynthesis protein [Salipaludibacillus neizhouensis]
MARKKQNKELSDKQRSLVTEYDKKSPISEQFRTLRTNIQFASVDRQLKTMMITSSSPGEGKSTTIANLGVVLAQQHNKVLLVDSDLRKPTVHFTFALPNQVGLTNVVTQQATFEDVVVATSIPRLDVLPSGPVPPNPSELLGSRAMKEFVTQVAKNYDYILFDAPPVNAVTDPQVLSRLVDGTILVIRSGQTEEELAKKAVESLKKVDANLLGVVLNDREMENSQYYYYYGEKG